MNQSIVTLLLHVRNHATNLQILTGRLQQDRCSKTPAIESRARNGRLYIRQQVQSYFFKVASFLNA